MSVPTKANMVVHKVGSLLLLRQNTETATPDEWTHLLETLVSLRVELPRLKIMVRTDGGGPTPTQRKSLEEALAGTPARVAVVSDHLKVRFVTSTIALFSKELRSFLVREMPEAYEHLAMTNEERRLCQKELTLMDGELAKKA